MEKITSFIIDHTRLLRGIYVSRKDPVGNETVTTFDMSMKIPNKEPGIDVPVLHTIEHLGATFLRKHPQWADKIIYFGPMGCRTGVYVLFAGDLESENIIPLMKEMFEYIAGYDDEIPGAYAVECGNYLSQDLPMAKWEAKKYLEEVIDDLKDENLNYPIYDLLNVARSKR